VSKDFWVVLGTQATMGFSAAFWMPAEQAWIAKNVDPQERARAIGGYSTFRGLFAFPAPFVGGVLFDAFGFDVPILLNLVLALVDVALILTLVRESIYR
jgi:MFS family permease